MKLGGWLVMLTAMIIFLSLLGLPTGLNSTLEQVGININQDTAQIESADIESSSLWERIFGSGIGILVILGGAAIVAIGLFARGYDPSLILIPFIVFVGGLYISTFWGIISYVATFNQTWMTSIIGLIFSTLAIGFIVSCVDYFGGR